MLEPRRARLPAMLALLAAAALSAAAAGQKDELLRARQLYNLQQFDAAIHAAERARQGPGLADAATLVGARARLERFRRRGNQADLDAARAALESLDPARLVARDRIELIIGLGVTLYLDGRTGAAAERFEQGLAQIDVLGPQAREATLDWWAGALEREARQLDPAEQQRIYARMLQRMEEELLRHSASKVASYWLVAAARGVGDIDRAWDAAVAGVVRVPGDTTQGAAFRADLDRLVTEAIIPERAYRIAHEGQIQQVIDTMRADWRALKERWAPR